MKTKLVRLPNVTGWAVGRNGTFDFAGIELFIPGFGNDRLRVDVLSAKTGKVLNAGFTLTGGAEALRDALVEILKEGVPACARSVLSV